MAFSKTNSAVAAPAAPAAEVPTSAGVIPSTPAPTVVSQKEDKKPLSQTEDKKVRGQVAMHAIIAGYNAASRLVLTLAPKPTESEDMLHTLAAKIAAKIEAYSFHD